MKPSKFIFFIGILVFLITARGAAPPPIVYKGRSLHVDEQLGGFPYRNFFVQADEREIYFVHTGAIDVLQRAELRSDAEVDFKNSQTILKDDLSKKNFWGARSSNKYKKVFLKLDEKNNEIFNIYELGLLSKKRRVVTHVSYVYEMERAPKSELIYYTGRTGKEFSPGHLGVIDIATGKEKIIFRDGKKNGFLTWASIDASADEKFFLLPLVCDQNRSVMKLTRIWRDQKLLPEEIFPCAKRKLRMIRGGTTATGFTYFDDESGFDVIKHYDFSSRKSDSITASNVNTNDAAIFGKNKNFLMTVHFQSVATEVAIHDLRSHRIVHQENVPGWAEIESIGSDDVYLSDSSSVVPYEIFSRGEPDFKKRVVLRYPEKIADQVVQCRATKVSFETFDHLSAPGEKAQLHAMLFEPKNPQTDRRERRLFVKAFYGGYNSFGVDEELFCEAGFYVISPATRGAWDWGSDLKNKINGDLGGGETLDAVWAAKFASQKLGIPSEKVGAYGQSHGGYETLRLLTMPNEINGQKIDFRFGFGVARAAFSLLSRYTKSANIAGWILELMGGEAYEKDPAKWDARSPELQASLASGPLFLSHGTADERVPIAESRAMTKALERSRKPFQYVEFPGQGHSLKGKDTLRAYYSDVFDFLSRLNPEKRELRPHGFKSAE